MLAARLLTRTLGIVSQSTQVERLLVTSRDQQALALATDTGALALPERGDQGLNAAVTQAAALAAQEGIDRILVVASDLPLLTLEDLQLLFEAAEESSVVLAPDRHSSGTNALYMTPPGLIQPAFGPDSYARHVLRAREAHIEPLIIKTNGLGFDLDVPSDYEDLIRMAPEEWGHQGFLAGLSA